MARLTIEISAKDADRAIKLLEKDMVSFNKQVQKSEKGVKSFSTNSASYLKKAAAATAGIFAIREATKFVSTLGTISDTYTKLRAKIDLVTNSSAEFNQIYSSLYQQGLNTGTQLEINAQAFSKLAQGMTDVKREDIVSYLDTVNKSLNVAGAGSSESASFMLQFGQAMGSSVVAGDELKSMIEANSYLMGKLATNLGTNIRGLKEMGSAGTLTRDVFAKALSEIAASVDDDFATIPRTIEKATSELSEVWKKLFADADEATRGSEGIAESIHNLARTIEENRDNILSLFEGMINGAAQVVESFANIGQSVKGFGALVSGDIGFFEYATADAEELHAALQEIKNDETGMGTAMTALSNILQTSSEISAGGLSLFGNNSSDITLLDSFADKWSSLVSDIKGKVDVAISMDLDTSNAEANLKQLSTMQKASAAEWLAVNEKASDKLVKKMTSDITKMNADLVASAKDFDAEIRDMQRSGMSDMGAWDDINAQIDEYKVKAAQAAKAGDWSGQADYLTRIKSLISDMPDEVTELVSSADVENARQVYQYQLRITSNGKNAYGSAGVAFAEAKTNYESLLKAQQDGERTILTSADTLKTKVEKTKEVNEQILANKEKQVQETEKEKTSMADTLAAYKEMASGAIEATSGLTTGVEAVGSQWVLVGDTWQHVSDGIVENIGSIANELDSAIDKMNKLNSGSSSSTSVDGTRANGGPVSAGRTYLVGEKGQELFTPSSSGYITPNNQIGGSGGSDRMVDINFSLNNGAPVKLQGSTVNVAELQRQMKEQARYAA